MALGSAVAAGLLAAALAVAACRRLLSPGRLAQAVGGLAFGVLASANFLAGGGHG